MSTRVSLSRRKAHAWTPARGAAALLPGRIGPCDASDPVNLLSHRIRSRHPRRSTPKGTLFELLGFAPWTVDRQITSLEFLQNLNRLSENSPELVPAGSCAAKFIANAPKTLAAIAVDDP